MTHVVLCYGSVVDLLWRMSTLVMKTALLRDTRSHAFVPMPANDSVSSADALLAIKAKIALKTDTLKRTSVERCRVQDEWLAFASTLTAKIQDVAAMQVRTVVSSVKVAGGSASTSSAPL